MKHLLQVAAIALLCLAPTMALADAWDSLNNHLRSETGIGDFTLDRNEFGNSGFEIVVHAGVEYFAASHNGYTVAYTPGDPGSPFIAGTPGRPAFYVPGGGRSYSEPQVIRNNPCGPGHWFTQIVGGKLWCTPAYLVGGGEGSTYIPAMAGTPDIAAVAATPRSCSVSVSGAGHDHSC